MSKLKARVANNESGKSGGLLESAQQIWLAGLGAFAKAQQEGTRLFEMLVREGMALEQKTRELASGKAQELRGAVQGTVQQVRERAADTWDRLEKVFEERVQRALARLGVPNREELKELLERVEALNAAIRELSGEAKPAKTARKGGSRRAARAASASDTSG
ncbi:MAG: phasin family protein [Xanthomonadales bacterium]|nr:phasin family protein [Xanthomonadales bacterium]